MTTVEASMKKNEDTVYFNLYAGDIEQISYKPKFKTEDKLRISKYNRRTFDKGYTPNWTEEIFMSIIVKKYCNQELNLDIETFIDDKQNAYFKGK